MYINLILGPEPDQDVLKKVNDWKSSNKTYLEWEEADSATTCGFLW